ncbi:FAD-dependent monooxygenase [Nocardia jinanensis]|nr:FAD-dependent monooxygenase [Nocardia jinanensis]
MNASTAQRALDTPVVISGAGPVGLSLALGLARAGVHCTVLEKKEKLDPHSRATLILARTLEIFDQWGVLDRFIAAGNVVPHARLREPTSEQNILHVNFTKLNDISATAYALALPQNETERILLDAVRGTGSVDIRFSTELVGFTQLDDGGIRYRARDEHGIETDGTATYLVGADGAHSTVRRQLGIELKGKTYPTQARLIDVRVAPEHDPAGEWPVLLDRRGIVVGIRFGNRVWRIIEQAVDPNLDAAALETHIVELTSELFGGPPEEIIWQSTYRKHERCATRYRSGNILLVGDAAHLNSPAGGQGMNSGVQDAHNLAWKLARCVLTHVVDSDALLDSYAEERRSLIRRRVLPATDVAERFQAARPHRRITIVRTLDKLFDFAHASGAITKRFAMIDVPYLESPILRRSRSRIGQRLPNTIDSFGQRIFDRINHGALLWAGEEHETPRELADQLNIPILNGDMAELTRFFDRDRYLALIRPDHIVGAIADPHAVDHSQFHRALGLIPPPSRTSADRAEKPSAFSG